MPHLPPVEMQDLDELKPILAMSEATMGFVPNSVSHHGAYASTARRIFYVVRHRDGRGRENTA